MELSQPQKDGPWKEWFLDLTGTCFLCLKDPASNTLLAGASGGGRVSLREICRYLEIKEVKENGFAVALCEPCFAHFNLLIGLIHEMEDIQRRMARQLQQFHGILEGSLEGDQSKQQWERILEENPIIASIVGCLRKQAGNKCQEKIRNLAMKTDTSVPIHGTFSTSSQLNETSSNSSSTQMDDVDSSNNATIESITATAPVPESSNHPSRKKRSWTRTDDNGDPHTDNSRKKLRSSRDVVMGIFDRNCRTLGNNGPLQFKCLHCENCVTADARKMRAHLLADHPETLFPSTKAPNLSDKMFVDCVKELLKRETTTGRVEAKSRKMLKDKNSNRESPLYCVPCENTYKLGTIYRYHLIVEHYDTLKQKLAHLQEIFSGRKLPMSSRILPSRRPRRERKIEDKKVEVEEFKCAVEEGGCGKIFSFRRGLERHKKESCPNSRVEAPWVCKPEDGGCGKAYSRKARLLIHQVDSCPTLNRGKKGLKRSKKSSTISVEAGLDGGPKILKGFGSGNKPSSMQMPEQSLEGNGSKEMEEEPEEKQEAICEKEGEGGKASEADVSSAFSGNEVKEEFGERSSLEFSGTADSTTADDNLFECNVFVVKSE